MASISRIFLFSALALSLLVYQRGGSTAATNHDDYRRASQHDDNDD
jgi:hypothetical protein